MKKFYLPPFFEALAKEYKCLTAARITVQEKGIYHIISEAGEQKAELSGKLRYETKAFIDFPAVGDYVMVNLNNGDTAIIHHVLKRKSIFVRKAAGTANTQQAVAANIDTVFLCMSFNNDFNLRRLERYLSVSWESGAMPVVVLTKADICSDVEEKIKAVEGVAMGIDIIVTSAMEKDGYSQILPYITEGKTVAFVGSSGVGKSTLINRLLGEDHLETKGLRNDDKGRHTTTHRELLILENGAMVIDTPGMREMGMWEASEGISTAFADIEEIIDKCSFKNCTHTNEPGCAIMEALESGELTPQRWQNYKKLMAENAYAEDAAGYMEVKKNKFKNIAKQNKHNKKQ